MARKTIKQRIALDGGKEIQRELEQLGEKGARAFKLLQEAANEVKGPQSGFVKSLEDAARKLDSLGRKFQSVGRQMQDVGKAFSTRVTLPIAGLGAGILKLSGDFEAAMNRIEAVSGATGDEIGKVRDLALQLGADTAFSASEAAGGIEMLLKNGLDLSQALGGATDAALKLAAATGSDLAGAADVATDVLQSFRLQAGEMGGAVNQIVGTLTASKFGFDDYRLAIGQVGGVAGGLGVKFEDLNAALASTSSLFASGSDAGTSFKSFLVSLVPRSKEAAAAIEQYGLRFFDASGNMRSMGEIAEELRVNLGGLSDRALSDAMKTIFGVDAMRTAIGLMRQGAAGVQNFRAQIAEGDAEAQATARMKGFNGAVEQLMGSLETLANRVADAGLLQWATDLVKTLDGMVDSFSKSNPETFKFGTVLAGVAAAIGPVVYGIGSLVAQIGFASLGFAQIGRMIAGVRAGLISLGALLATAGWVGAIAVIGGGIAAWAMSTDSATAAMQQHEGVVGRVEEAYRKAGLEVAKMTQEVRDRLLIEARDSLNKTSKELASALEDARAELLQWDGSINAIAAPMFALVRQFANGTITVAEFQSTVLRLGALDPRLGKLAGQMAEVTDNAAKLSLAVTKDADSIAWLEGRMSDAQFRAKYFADEQRVAAAETTRAGAAANETARQVEELGKTITVHSSGASGPVKQTFELVDGVARATAESRKQLDELGGGADQTAARIGALADGIVQVPEALKGQPAPAEVLTRGMDEAAAGLQQTFTAVPEQARAAIDGVISEVGRIQPAIAGALAGGTSDGPKGEERQQGGIAEALAAPFQEARDRISVILAEIPTLVGAVVNWIAQSASEAGGGLGEALVAPFADAGERITDILERMTATVARQFEAMLASVRAMVQEMRSQVANLEALAARAAAARAEAGSGGGSGSGRRFAGGGQVSGPGTATSDSILAWLSDGEYVIRAAAVQKYGSGLLAALNGLRLPKDFFKGFALGGPVDLSGIAARLTGGMHVSSRLPALAAGGAVTATGGRPIMLSFDGASYPMIAPEDVADRLAKHAGRVSLRRAGGKPGWR